MVDTGYASPLPARLRRDGLVRTVLIYDRRQGLISTLVSIIHRTGACGRCNRRANIAAANAACSSGTVGCAAPGTGQRPNLSGTLLKPLISQGYPNGLPFVPIGVAF